LSCDISNKKEIEKNSNINTDVLAQVCPMACVESDAIKDDVHDKPLKIIKFNKSIIHDSM